MSPQPLTIFDVDGTLCDVRTLRHLVTGPRKDFDRFHEESADCPPNTTVVERLRVCAAFGHHIAIVTGRTARWRGLTEDWLQRHSIGYDSYHSRADGDFSSDDVVKAQILGRLRQRYQVIAAFDDRPRVIRLWHGQGLRVTIAHGWFEDTEPNRPIRLTHVPVGGRLPRLYATEDMPAQDR